MATPAERSRALFPGGSLNPVSTTLYLSLAHTDADVGRFLDLAQVALREAPR